jgi:hypothetical protein
MLALRAQYGGPSPYASLRLIALNAPVSRTAIGSVTPIEMRNGRIAYRY